MNPYNQVSRQCGWLDVMQMWEEEAAMVSLDAWPGGRPSPHPPSHVDASWLVARRSASRAVAGNPSKQTGTGING